MSMSAYLSVCTHVSLPYWLLLSRAAPFADPVAPAQTLPSPLLSGGTRPKRARMQARARTQAHACKPTFKCTQAESVLRRGTPGQYVIYRPDEAMEMPDDKFMPVCVSYLTDELEPAHNLVYFNVSALGGWAPFLGWVTIDPEPWTAGDPVSLLSGNMLFPNMYALCEVLPELEQRVDPHSGEVMAMEKLADFQDAAAQSHHTYTELNSFKGAPAGNSMLSNKSGQLYNEAPARGDPRAVQFGKPRGWMGDAADKDLYRMLSWNGYILSTAITATVLMYVFTHTQTHSHTNTHTHTHTHTHKHTHTHTHTTCMHTYIHTYTHTHKHTHTYEYTYLLTNTHIHT